MNFSARIRRSGEISIVDVAGRLTNFELTALRDAFESLLAQGRRNIVLNLKELDFMDSSAIGEVVRSYRAVTQAGGELKVVGLSPKIEQILAVTHLTRVLTEFPSEEAALRSFATEGVPEASGQAVE